jgi:lactoylglutathione lyase
VDRAGCTATAERAVPAPVCRARSHLSGQEAASAAGPRLFRSYPVGMDTLGFESLILFVSDLEASRAFYVNALGLPVVFEDDIIVVVGGPTGRVVLHRNDRGHDERGIFPAGDGIGGAAVRFFVEDPDECERQSARLGLPVLWPAQDASWGRFVVLADPDGRSVVLARMNRPVPPSAG